MRLSPKSWLSASAAAIGLLAAGCAPLSVESQTPRSITLAYDPILSSAQEAADLAQSHCQTQGKHARQTDRTVDMLVYLSFDCVD